MSNRITLENAVVGTRGTLISNHFAAPRGAMVELLPTPLVQFQGGQRLVSLIGQGYSVHLPYNAQIDVVDAVDYGEGLVHIGTVLRPLLKLLREQHGDVEAVHRLVDEETRTILSELERDR